MRCLRTLNANEHANDVFGVTALCGRVVSASSDETLRVWDAADWRCLQVLRCPPHFADDMPAGDSCVAALPGGRLCSGAQINTLNIWADPEQLMERPLARAIARRRIRCEDVAKVICKFL